MSEPETPETVELTPLPPYEQLMQLFVPDEVPPVPHGMKKFIVYRRFDESGVSGTGVVVQGCTFADGQAAYQWMNGKSPELEYRQNFEKFLDIHIRSHPKNRTVIVWEDGTKDYYGEDEAKEA